MIAFAGNLHFVGPGITAEIAAELFVRRHCAQTWFVGTKFLFLFSHDFSLPLLVIFYWTMDARLVLALLCPSVALHH